ncbi:unnamed protein product [Cyprideis torosa]|uniref:Uncharacterized protein n=1 Tax=Cyprideis torosa TaxID=163714 RepID=A0A7R8ZYA0_9CRUS|nr:unnamed protein product [Cyprideis torosa]CAG0908246.1 unnamed protein product [Cyprideis torosa]
MSTSDNQSAPFFESHSPVSSSAQDFQRPRQFRPLEDVTCYKCGGRGHYANRCQKGYLAFLSSENQNAHEEDNRGHVAGTNPAG